MNPWLGGLWGNWGERIWRLCSIESSSMRIKNRRERRNDAALTPNPAFCRHIPPTAAQSARIPRARPCAPDVQWPRRLLSAPAFLAAGEGECGFAAGVSLHGLVLARAKGRL